MAGIIPYYNDFKNFFLSGFDYNSFDQLLPTFPMWGYGAVMMLSNKLIIIVLQMLMMVYVTYKWDKHLQKDGNVNIYFRFLVLIGFCYILFQIPLWPYSISASLISLAILKIIIGDQRDRPIDLLVAGLLLGIAINFRSDFLYYVYFIIISLFIASIIKRVNYKLWHIIGFTSIIVCLLIPWMFHTYNVTGKYLTSSTNGGHVLWLGLGISPNNNFGVVADDGDPKMIDLITEKIGNVSSLSYQADSLLKKEWIKEVSNQPSEFIKKCVYTIYLTVTRPFAIGQTELFFKEKEKIDILKDQIKSDLYNFKILNLVKNIFNGSYLSMLLPLILNLINIILFLFFVLVIGKEVYYSFSEIWNNLTYFLLLSLICYQVSLQTVAYYLPNYHTNVYLAYALLTSLYLTKKPKVLSV